MVFTPTGAQVPSLVPLSRHSLYLVTEKPCLLDFVSIIGQAGWELVIILSPSLRCLELYFLAPDLGQYTLCPCLSKQNISKKMSKTQPQTQSHGAL